MQRWSTKTKAQYVLPLSSLKPPVNFFIVETSLVCRLFEFLECGIESSTKKQVLQWPVWKMTRRNKLLLNFLAVLFQQGKPWQNSVSNGNQEIDTWADCHESYVLWYGAIFARSSELQTIYLQNIKRNSNETCQQIWKYQVAEKIIGPELRTNHVWLAMC